MDALEYRRFTKEDYPVYAAWFSDPDLQRRLGPLDQAWLEAILSETEAQGVTWGVWRAAELVAVVETVFDPEQPVTAWITAVATKPSLRRQGLATAVLRRTLAVHYARGIVQHVAYVAADNLAGRRSAERVGFRAATVEPNEHGYLKFEHNRE